MLAYTSPQFHFSTTK